MTRNLALVLMLWAAPAAAYEPMTLTDCQNAWLKLTDVVEVGILPSSDDAVGAAELRGMTVLRTPDGWCRFSAETPGMESVEYLTFDWQIEGLNAWVGEGRLPLALRLRVDGLDRDDLSPVPISVAMALRQIPGTGQLLIERYTISDADGVAISMTAVLDGAYLGTTASAFSSLGGTTLSQAEVMFDIKPDRTRANGNALLDDFASLGWLIENLPEGLDDSQMSAGDRRQLSALAKDYPGVDGQLTLGLRSERGLGWLQVVRALDLLADPAEAISFALSGTQVSVDWAPR